MFEQFIGTKPVEERHKFETGALELLCEIDRRRLTGPSTRDSRSGADVNPAAQKRSRRQDDGAGTKAPSFDGLHAGNDVAIEDQSGNGALNRT